MPGFQPGQLLPEIVQHLGVIALDGEGVGGLEQIEIVFRLAEGFVIGFPCFDLLLLLPGREVASPADHHAGAAGADLVVPVDGFGQRPGVAVKQILGVFLLGLGAAQGFDPFQDGGGLGNVGVVSRGRAALLVVVEGPHFVREAGGGFVDGVSTHFVYLLFVICPRRGAGGRWGGAALDGAALPEYPAQIR